MVHQVVVLDMAVCTITHDQSHNHRQSSHTVGFGVGGGDGNGVGNGCYESMLSQLNITSHDTMHSLLAMVLVCKHKQSSSSSAHKHI